MRVYPVAPAKSKAPDTLHGLRADPNVSSHPTSCSSCCNICCGQANRKPDLLGGVPSSLDSKLRKFLSATLHALPASLPDMKGLCVCVCCMHKSTEKHR